MIGKSIEKFLTERYEGWEGSRQFEGTGKRWDRWVEEMCLPPEKFEEEIKRCLKVFPDKYDEMLVSGPSGVWTLCPHHILPCLFKVYIGYIPNGNVLGLSKFTRIAEIMGKRPTMQEEYTRELADYLYEKLEPRGLGVKVVGVHGCMSCRGVKQEVPVSTSILKGKFMTELAVREEFYNTVGKQ